MSRRPLVWGADDVSVGELVWATVTAVVFLLPLAITVWAFLDAASRPSWAWGLSGRSRLLWMGLIAFGVFTVVGGLIISGIYLARIRPLVASAERGDLSDP